MTVLNCSVFGFCFRLVPSRDVHEYVWEIDVAIGEWCGNQMYSESGEIDVDKFCDLLMSDHDQFELIHFF